MAYEQGGYNNGPPTPAEPQPAKLWIAVVVNDYVAPGKLPFISDNEITFIAQAIESLVKAGYYVRMAASGPLYDTVMALCKDYRTQFETWKAYAIHDPPDADRFASKAAEGAAMTYRRDWGDMKSSMQRIAAMWVQIVMGRSTRETPAAVLIHSAEDIQQLSYQQRVQTHHTGIAAGVSNGAPIVNLKDPNAAQRVKDLISVFTAPITIGSDVPSQRRSQPQQYGSGGSQYNPQPPQQHTGYRQESSHLPPMADTNPFI